MNKLELFERNFQLVTNDFFAKFLLINEKLNKVELTLQTKWNDLEAKLRNSVFADSFNNKSPSSSSSSPLSTTQSSSLHHQQHGSSTTSKSTNVFQQMDSDDSTNNVHENFFKENLIIHQLPTNINVQNNPEYGNNNNLQKNAQTVKQQWVKPSTKLSSTTANVNVNFKLFKCLYFFSIIY